MTEHQNKKKETPLVVWMVLGGLVGAGIVGALIDMIAHDWILEYSRWIFWAIVAVFVLFGVALRGRRKHV